MAKKKRRSAQKAPEAGKEAQPNRMPDGAPKSIPIPKPVPEPVQELPSEPKPKTEPIPERVPEPPSIQVIPEPEPEPEPKPGKEEEPEWARDPEPEWERELEPELEPVQEVLPESPQPKIEPEPELQEEPEPDLLPDLARDQTPEPEPGSVEQDYEHPVSFHDAEPAPSSTLDALGEFIRNHDRDAADATAKTWAYQANGKESPVHFSDTGFTHISDDDVERNASVGLTVEINASSAFSVDEGYENPNIEEPEPVTEITYYDQLPRIPPPNQPLGAEPRNAGWFDLERVIGTIQNGYSVEELREYLSYYHDIDADLLKDSLNEEIVGLPAIFFVVETNDAELIRYWIKYGGDPNATYGPIRFPVLAFAILRCARPRLQAAKTVETLLRLGASPLVIPAAYYDPFDRDLPESGPDEKELQDIVNSERLWCSPEIRPQLAAALSLTQRYLLWRASRLEPPSGRERTLALRRNAEEILGLEQTIIGQRLAAWTLKKSFLVNLAIPGRKPLVLFFGGLKGHGKSDLVNQLGRILSLDIERVNLTHIKSEDELFGLNAPEQGHELGSPLNNFLARKTGQRSIVFIEEFEKTSEDIRKALLSTFDLGEYTDRRNSQKIDCADTIWVLSTDKFDNTIRSFCEANSKLLRDSDLRLEHFALKKQLSRQLRHDCIANFGARLTSRVTEIVPFLTFNADEQLVLADKYIMELEERVAGPVVDSVDPEEESLIGNVRLKITNNATVCSTIANEYYLPELGAKSISRGVDSVIATPLIGLYLEDGDDFSEDQPETKYKVGVNEENEVEVSPLSDTIGTNGYLGFKYSW
ncbi:P-loop containing nucleoside triphosphate hydrolase protein [Daldinia decipiens]|uniref:P-loop containing nucleoside triphosphate hydrolase protein n=1 Tax=Daldinia decipiens TaxID=326647 RepID=UPI0020C3C3D9|nr:P-loop containing nucleoside triphosphate hydrolase protein [Daldinia decipiens]KAI1660670.1 P-loop containing nucleoside triphosphate hydrolase protein [Daldinia decipiens]